MIKRIIPLFMVMALALQTAPALGQSAASPVMTPGTSEWTVAAIGGYFRQGVGSTETVDSYRALLKSSWGVTPWMDLYIMGGAANLRIETPNKAVTPLEDKFKACYGLGMNLSMQLSGLGKTGLWGGVQALRWQPEGDFTEPDLIGSDLFLRRKSMAYDWRELKVFAGIAIPVGSVKFYAGGAGWWLQRKDSMTEYLEQGEARSVIQVVENDTQSGLWTGGIAGVELRLPENFALSLEVLAFNTSNVQVFISLLQTGSTAWKPLN